MTDYTDWRMRQAVDLAAVVPTTKVSDGVRARHAPPTEDSRARRIDRAHGNARSSTADRL